MSTRALKRAARDFELLQAAVGQSSTITSVKMADQSGQETDAADIFHWRVEVRPPESSVYAGDTYVFLFSLSPQEYPILPPSLRVISPIFSPVVSAKGEVCEALLKNDLWKPTMPITDVASIVTQAVFVDYTKHEVLNDEAAEFLSKATEKEFKERVESVRRLKQT